MRLRIISTNQFFPENEHDRRASEVYQDPIRTGLRSWKDAGHAGRSICKGSAVAYDICDTKRHQAMAGRNRTMFRMPTQRIESRKHFDQFMDVKGRLSLCGKNYDVNRFSMITTRDPYGDTQEVCWGDYFYNFRRD
jgi:hypothetical protein